MAGVVREVGSGLDGKRPELRRVLSDPCARVIVVEHRGQLARFGVGHPGVALAARGRRVLAAGPGEMAGDLVGGMMEALTLRCARRYGCGGARHRALRAVTAATMAGVDAAA